MKLRKLKKSDALYMLEWMHDSDVTEYLFKDFAHKGIKDCEDFIDAAQDTEHDMHFAVTNDDDEYIGTVSLKHITDYEAEFAITMRKSAQGQGYSRYGMKEIIRIGFEDRGLRKIYWNVLPENKRAVKFYDKMGYKRFEPCKIQGRGYTLEQIKHFIWYKVERKITKEK